MKTYGYLFGFIRLIKDLHHDEVFIERNNVVIMRNNQWLYSYSELLRLSRELGHNPDNKTKVNYQWSFINWEEMGK